MISVKNRSIFTAVICLAAFAILCMIFQYDAYAATKRIDAVSYNMDLRLDTGDNTLYEKVTIKVKNDTDKTVTGLCLRNMAAAVLDYDMKNYSEDNSGLTADIKSIRLKGSKKDLKFTESKKGSVINVKLGSKGKIRPGKTKCIVVRMKTDIPVREDRFGFMKAGKNRIYALSWCFPYLADNINGKWQTDPYFDDGESRSWDLADYRVTFRAPKAYKVAATGKSTTKNGKTVIRADRVRDLGIVACNTMKKDSFKVKGIRVNSYYINGKEMKKYRKIVKLTAKDSIRLFTEKVGKYPYKELDIVPCIFGFGAGGMEYPGLVMANATSFVSGNYPDPTSLGEIVAHEIGHQWFYAVVGNREYKEAWLDEGFTTYLEKNIWELSRCDSLKYIRQIDDMAWSRKQLIKDRDEWIEAADEMYKGTYINTPPNKYKNSQSYGEAEYNEAYIFLEKVRVQMGNKKFSRFLKDYYKTFRFKRTTTKKTVEFIKKYDNSKSMNRLIKKYIRLK